MRQRLLLSIFSRFIASVSVIHNTARRRHWFSIAFIFLVIFFKWYRPTQPTSDVPMRTRAYCIQYVLIDCPCLRRARSRQASPGNCRFELACAQCPGGCERELSNVTIERSTLPACDPIPVGVWPSPNSTTLQTFDLKEGYYRTSVESPVVLECYQKDACSGGINPDGYCAIGYTGPCESTRTNLCWMRPSH